MIRSIVLLILLAAPVVAQEQGHAPYAGLETREIKSLSGEDLEELQRGGGWGLALPAELNGLPGPAHLLILRDEIGLSPEQVEEIEAIHAAMTADAQAAGLRFIEAERALDAAFQEGTLDETRLRELVAAAESARAELRFVHLSRHLSTPPLLTKAPIARYNELRGYASDPCATVPEGHDAEMWRRHHNCGG
jgi:hypothetical protein